MLWKAVLSTILESGGILLGWGWRLELCNITDGNSPPHVYVLLVVSSGRVKVPV